MLRIVKRIACGSNRKPNIEYTGLMESLNIHGTWERERERERVNSKNSIQNNTQSLYIGCAQRALLYKSIWTDRSTDKYFNAH